MYKISQNLIISVEKFDQKAKIVVIGCKVVKKGAFDDKGSCKKMGLLTGV